MLRDDVAAPLRTNHAIDVPGEAAASLLLMPAWRVGHRIGVKLVTVFPGNRTRGERAVNAVYALFDARNGAAGRALRRGGAHRAPYRRRVGARGAVTLRAPTRRTW